MSVCHGVCGDRMGGMGEHVVWVCYPMTYVSCRGPGRCRCLRKRYPSPAPHQKSPLLRPMQVRCTNPRAPFSTTLPHNGWCVHLLLLPHPQVPEHPHQCPSPRSDGPASQQQHSQCRDHIQAPTHAAVVGHALVEVALVLIGQTRLWKRADFRGPTSRQCYSPRSEGLSIQRAMLPGVKTSLPRWPPLSLPSLRPPALKSFH